MIARFTSPQAANKAIRQGVIVQGRRVMGEKTINGPIRCYHCQRYGHIAGNCPSKNEPKKCPTCTNVHERDECQAKRKGDFICVNCNDAGHATWDPSCPAHQREMEKTIQRDTEAKSKFYQTEEDWTQEIDQVYATRGEKRRGDTTGGDQKRRWGDEEEEEGSEDEEQEDEMEIEEGEVEDLEQSLTSTHGKARGPYTQATLERFGYARRSLEDIERIEE